MVYRTIFLSSSSSSFASLRIFPPRTRIQESVSPSLAPGTNPDSFKSTIVVPCLLPEIGLGPCVCCCSVKGREGISLESSEKLLDVVLPVDDACRCSGNHIPYPNSVNLCLLLVNIKAIFGCSPEAYSITRAHIMLEPIGTDCQEPIARHLQCSDLKCFLGSLFLTLMSSPNSGGTSR